MPVYHEVINSIDCKRVVRELTQVGELPENPESFARESLDNGGWLLNVGKVNLWCSQFLREWVAEKDLPANRMSLFITRPDTGLGPTPWHYDGIRLYCAVNIPWFGTESVKTQWHSGVGLKPYIVRNEDGTIDRIEGHGNVEPQESDVLHDQAWALNVGAYHRVDNTGSLSYRGILSLRFCDYLTYEQLLEKLK